MMMTVMMMMLTKFSCWLFFKVPCYHLPPLIVIAMACIIVTSSLLTELAYTSLALAFVALSLPVHVIVFEDSSILLSQLQQVMMTMRSGVQKLFASTAPLASRSEEWTHWARCVAHVNEDVHIWVFLCIFSSFYRMNATSLTHNSYKNDCDTTTLALSTYSFKRKLAHQHSQHRGLCYRSH